jgi:hypothetical protein
MPGVPTRVTPNGTGAPAAEAAPAVAWGKPTKAEKPAPGLPPATVVTLWRKKIEYLADDSKNGELNPGLVGQLFLLDPQGRFVTADGTLAVALYDETPRPPGQAGNIPEMWEFKKEALRGLRTQDERFGLSYGLFLPWVTYRPDVTRVRIAARFEPEGAGPLYAQDTWITFDAAGQGYGGAGWTNVSAPPVGPAPAVAWSPAGPPPGAAGPGLGVTVSGARARAPAPAPAPVVPLPPPTATIDRAPANYGSLAPPGPVAPVGGPVPPPNLPPIAFTAGRPFGQ